MKPLFSLIICFLMTTNIGKSLANAEDEKSTDVHDKIVITKENIREMKVHSMVELLNQIPGVSATETSVKFRGSSVKNILVLLDGRVINDPTSSYRAVNWDMISVSAIERIEIHKGTGSVTYGDDSSGGVISITTKRVGRGLRSNLKVSYGGFNGQNYDLNYQQNLANFGLALYPGWEKTDGFRDNYDKDKKRIGIKLSYELNKRRSMSLSVDYSEYKRGIPGPTYSPTPRARAEDKSLGATFLLPIHRLKSRTHYSGFERRYKNPDADIENILESRALSQDFSSTISAGKFGRFNIGTNFEVAHVEGNKITPAQLNEKYAVYITRDIRLPRIPIRLGLGLRANFYSEFPTAINPQVQLNYRYYNLDIRLSVNRANNIPNLYQRYYEGTTRKPNPNLGMERAMNYSLGFSSRLKEWLEGEVSFFLSNLRDKITCVHEGDIVTYKNVGATVKKGVETNAKWKFKDLWQVNSSYTYLIAKDKDTGKYLTHSPKHRLNINLQLKPLRYLFLGLNIEYLSKQYVNMENTKSLAGRHLEVDFKMDCCVKRNIKLFFKMDNMLDKYHEWGCGEPYAPRIWVVGMGYEFSAEGGGGR